MEERPSILVVDDNQGSLLAYRTILNPLKLHVTSAKSGEEALHHLLNADFALVLLDVRMPGMDGFEVAELMRERDRSKETPILFLTAQDTDNAQIQRANDLGASGLLTKPIAPEDLLWEVAHILGIRP
jgi:CheY-like chemotaxis protein